MNRMSLYTIYDKIANEAGPLFQAKNDQVAVRASVNLLHGALNPDDYKIVHVGYFDVETCEVIPLPEPQDLNFTLSSDGTGGIK